MKTGDKEGKLNLRFPRPFSCLVLFSKDDSECTEKLKKNCIVEVLYFLSPVFNVWFDFITFESFNVMVYDKDKMSSLYFMCFC